MGGIYHWWLLSWNKTKKGSHPTKEVSITLVSPAPWSPALGPLHLIHSWLQYRHKCMSILEARLGCLYTIKFPLETKENAPPPKKALEIKWCLSIRNSWFSLSQCLDKRQVVWHCLLDINILSLPCRLKGKRFPWVLLCGQVGFQPFQNLCLGLLPMVGHTVGKRGTFFGI